MLLSPYGSIAQFFQTFEETLSEVWQADAFGHIVIDSQRCGHAEQAVFLHDSTTYLFSFSQADLIAWKTTRTGSSPPDEVTNLLICVEQRLLRTWEATGWGRLEVKCDRAGKSSVRVLLTGAPSYCFHLSDRAVQRWITGLM